MPVPLAIDAHTDALVAVDVQNDFCPGGALGVARGDEVVPVLNRYARRFARAGARVVVTRDWHPARTRHFRPFGGIWPPHCVQGTPGAALRADFRPPPGAVLVSKGTDPDEDAYSCFHGRTEDGTPFAEALAAWGIRRLFVGGLATDYCVRFTALDALRAGLEVVILEDAVRAVDLSPGDGARALDEVRRAGAATARLDDLGA